MAAFKVAAAHAASILLDKEASLAKAAEIVREAGRAEIRLVCFPEAFVPGFPYWINLYPPGLQHGIHHLYWRRSVDVAAGELRPVQEAARAAGTAVALGISERAGGTMYNAQAFIGPDGALLGLHRKLQPTFAERMLWGQGDGASLKVFETPFGTIGGLICYEHMMNLARQALIAQGLQIHCASWPTFASTQGRGGAFDETVETLMKAHALTGQCFVLLAENPVTEQYLSAMAGVLGEQTALGTGGGVSAIYGPDGRLLAGPHRGLEERLVVAEIDLDAIARAKVLVDATGHYARPEILRLVVDGRAQTGFERRE